MSQCLRLHVPVAAAQSGMGMACAFAALYLRCVCPLLIPPSHAQMLDYGHTDGQELQDELGEVGALLLSFPCNNSSVSQLTS